MSREHDLNWSTLYIWDKGMAGCLLYEEETMRIWNSKSLVRSSVDVHLAVNNEAPNRTMLKRHVYNHIILNLHERPSVFYLMRKFIDFVENENKAHGDHTS